MFLFYQTFGYCWETMKYFLTIFHYPVQNKSATTSNVASFNLHTSRLHFHLDLNCKLFFSSIISLTLLLAFFSYSQWHNLFLFFSSVFSSTWPSVSFLQSSFPHNLEQYTFVHSGWLILFRITLIQKFTFVRAA